MDVVASRQLVGASRRLPLAYAMAVLVTLGVLGLVPAGATAGEKVTVTPYGPKGLDNPRGLAFGPDGRLYVAESGNGGAECVPGEHSEEEAFPCVGFTSGISSIDAHDGHKVLSGFVSISGKEGVAAEGIEGLGFDNDGGLFAVVGTNAHELPTPPNPFISTPTLEQGRDELGRLIHLRPTHQSSGQFETVADVGGFDFQWAAEHFPQLNPEQGADGNPYAVYAAPHERFVVDAAANTLDEVSQSGSVSVLAFIPNPAHSDAVPTCISRGRDGAFYIGELTGVGNGPGASVVWRVVEGQTPEGWAKGLTAVTGCGFGRDGKFYATEFSTLGFESFAPGTGALVQVPPHSSAPIPIVSNTPGQNDSPLSFPNGFASRDGSIYVSNWSVAPASSSVPLPFIGLGQVVRIRH